METTTVQTAKAPAAKPSLFEPLLQLPVYRFIWMALLAHHVCSWLMDVTNGWLMSSLSSSPVWVALVQTATTLPVLMLALPAGAIADIFKRRSILLYVEGGLVLSNSVLAALTWLGWVTPELLLLLVFVNSVFLAIGMPAWQSLIPEVVRGPLLGSSLMLGGLAAHVSRAIGPALAGVLIATGGPAASFAASAAGYVFVWFALELWVGPVARVTTVYLPAEQVLGGVASGIRYCLHDTNLQRILMRLACVSVAAAAFWATLPLTARQGLGMDSTGYGLLLACFGAGALLGAWLMSRHLATADINVIVAVNSIVFALCMAGFAVLGDRMLAYPLMFIVGIAWLAVSSSFAVSLNSTVAAWVRARALSLMLVAMQGSLAVGSLVWGLVAQAYGVPVALTAGAVLMLAGLATTYRQTLSKGDMSKEDGYSLPTLALGDGVVATRTPVTVQLEYRISAGSSDDFVKGMRSVGAMRQRNGATAWNLLEDMAQPGRWIESFDARSLEDHERQRERLTQADEDLLISMYAMHQGGGARPVLTRWLGRDKVVG